MVVLSVALCTRSGKPVLARQFVEMPRMRIEALLASFPKLISPTKQHTYVESDSVRYVFQPMETLYLLMITTKISNIVEDLDTLRLLSKVVVDACPQVTEEAVTDAAFELVAAFDEVISLGYREAINLPGIRANLEMKSHEEDLSKMIRQSKETEAKQEMKRQAAAIRAKKAAEMSGGGGMGGGSKMQGFGSSGTYMPPSASPSAYGGGSSGPIGGSTGAKPSPPSPTKAAAAPKKGLMLEKKQKNVLEAVAHEDGMDTDELEGIKLSAQGTVSAPGAVSVPKDPVHVAISETVSATIQQDGSLASYSVSGQVQLVSRQEDARFSVQFNSPSSEFAFKPHPQLDKAKWDKNAIIELKQADRSIPTNTAFGALKYRSNKVDDISLIPLALTVWPEAGKGGITNVNLEYELHGDVELHNVTIVIPLGSQEAPIVKQSSVGTHRHNSRRHQLEWVIDTINADNATGTFEFDLPKSDPSSFFPTVISFAANESLAGLQVASVTNLADGSPIRFGQETTVTTDAYEVVSDE